MASKKKTPNPMSEYLLKLQLIVSNTEFKNKEEADKYETLESRLAGDNYVDALLEKDVFDSYEFTEKTIKSVLTELKYPDDVIRKCIANPQLIPTGVSNALVKYARSIRIASYKEPNKYYLNLMGQPLIGTDPVFPVEDAFYALYQSEGIFHKECPIHLLPTKQMELYMNSDYFKKLIQEYPDVEYLRHMGSNSIPLTVSRKAKDGEIMKINISKLETTHEIFGKVSVSPDIVHQFVNVYEKTRRYVYNTLRGDFALIYPNYNSFIRLLTIYITMGTCMNEFMHKSTKLIYMNNAIANDYFSLYGLPSVLMESNSLINFLKKFRQLLMDKGTNTVYRVKDIIGYQYTDIFTLVMVKQQVFKNGYPIYYKDPDTGEMKPQQNIYFRRMGTADDNTSYFQFRNEKKNYTVEEITSGDPRWWNTPEVQQMIQEMNYTLSNSKYIQLSTTMDMDDIWWQTCILLRGLLDNRKETQFTNIGLTQSLNGTNNINVFEAALILIIMMTWNHTDFLGDHFSGDLYLPNGNYVHQSNLGKCVDMLFNGLHDDGSPKDLEEGGPYQVSSFNFDIAIKNKNRYDTLKKYEYLQPELMERLDSILAREHVNVGEALMKDIKYLFKYLETKLRTASTIREFRQVTDAYNWLFLVDPYRKDWIPVDEFSTYELLKQSYGITDADLMSLYRFFQGMNPNTIDEDGSHGYQTLTDDDKYITFYPGISDKQMDYIEEDIPSEFGFPKGTKLGIIMGDNPNFSSKLLGLTKVWGYSNNEKVFEFVIQLDKLGRIVYLDMLQSYADINDYIWQIEDLYDASDVGSDVDSDISNKKKYGCSMIIYRLDSDITKLYIPDLLNRSTNVLDVYPEFNNTEFLRSFNQVMESWTCSAINDSALSVVLKNNYRDIIQDKVMLDISNSQYGPRSFEALLFLTNPKLYRDIVQYRGDGEQLLIYMRSIIRALESYTHSPLPALEFEATGKDEYIRILKEVITYFKSYMVEFTKSEFQYIFGGLFDHGGNSNMLALFDEINHVTLRMLPRDVLHLYDVSCAKARVIVKDDISNFLYDEALFRIKAKYSVLKQLGYEIWFDHDEYIDMEPFDNLSDDTVLIAEIHEDTSGTYKIIINQENM